MVAAAAIPTFPHSLSVADQSNRQGLRYEISRYYSRHHRSEVHGPAAAVARTAATVATLCRSRDQQEQQDQPVRMMITGLELLSKADGANGDNDKCGGGGDGHDHDQTDVTSCESFCNDSLVHHRRCREQGGNHNRLLLSCDDATSDEEESSTGSFANDNDDNDGISLPSLPPNYHAARQQPGRLHCPMGMTMGLVDESARRRAHEHDDGDNDTSSSSSSSDDEGFAKDSLHAPRNRRSTQTLRKEVVDCPLSRPDTTATPVQRLARGAVLEGPSVARATNPAA